MYRLATTSVNVSGGSPMSASYTYTDDQLTTLTTASTTYNFSYGAFSQISSVKVGTQALASYSYTNDRNRHLDTLTYGNNDSVEYTYDDLGRVILETYEDGDTVSYKYDNTGALATVTDSESGIKTSYYYDLTDRLAMYTEKGSGYNHVVQNKYDEKNRLTQRTEIAGTMSAAEFYYYDDDNRVTDIVQGSIEESYTYDAFGRTTQRKTKNGTTVVLTENLTYRTVSGAPTGQVASLSSVASGYNGSLSYTYDDNGNILSVSDGTYTTTYVYDSANQLTRENNQAAGKTWTWTYDGAGNIQNRKEYAYTTGTLGAVQQQVNYLYDSTWGDLLTSYNGTAISSDAIGNMLSDGTWSYTWQHGRELASMTDGSTTWSFTYNADGMRTSRSNGSTTYKYFYIGGRLSHMLIGSSYVHFAYDASGSPIWMRYDGTRYYYVTNLQGDVIAILDSTGATVVQYTYDAWGKVLSITGSMADTIGTINPLLYRGYIYDHDTGLYYLQSRYYNPTIGRFICADVYVATGQGFIGNNMFVYCLNNPINRTDLTGSVGLWSFLISSHDMGLVHRLVVNHIQSNYKNLETEKKLSTYGRADVKSGNAVWEVKHAGKDPNSRILLAWAQATTYIFLNEELTTLGAAYAFSGTFYIKYSVYSYMIEYFTPADGVILYTITEVQDYQGEYSYAFETSKEKAEDKQSLKTPAGATAFAPQGSSGGLMLGAFVLMLGVACIAVTSTSMY